MPNQDQSAAAYSALAAADATGLQLYSGVSTTTTFDASFSGSLGFRLWAKEDVQAAVGVDVRREEYEFSGPAQWSAGNAYVFGAPGDSSNYMSPKRRDVKAVFAEFNVPVVDSLELNLAVRRDQYDGFGASTNPKYSFKWQPIDWLAFRGSYSTGFKVPDFAKLFRGITETQYTGLDLADPSICPEWALQPGRGQLQRADPPRHRHRRQSEPATGRSEAEEHWFRARTDIQDRRQRRLVGNRAVQHHPQRLQA